MAPNTAQSEAVTAGPGSEGSVSPPAESANEAVIAAIRDHHSRLAEQLRGHTDAALAAAAAGSGATERDTLHEWYRTELLPHAAAEERALYGPAATMAATELLIRGMLAEHRKLEELVLTLSLACTPVEIAAVAASGQALFDVHLAKENDLLLPALDEAGFDLPAMLAGMHEILGHAPDTIELDVRELPHGKRHEIIFATLDRLQPGQALVIVNDHDPKPLGYQVSSLWPDRFDWSYLHSGPEVWRVAITRVG